MTNNAAPIAQHVISTPTHGRYLVRPPAQSGPAPLMVGFHGYAESAELQLERLTKIPGADAWLLVSIQGLHRFYRARTQEVIASWMTRQDRELALADNRVYVAGVISSIRKEHEVTLPWVFAGFSQGVAMAFRAACHLSNRENPGNLANPENLVLSNGGDIPPELDRSALSALGGVLLARGADDPWYKSELMTRDTERLRDATVEVEAVTLEGAHEWTESFSRAAGSFLNARAPRAPRNQS